MAYDPKSYELAEHFLKDTETETETQYKLLCDALATVIQETIELWLNANEPKPDTPQGPEAA